jgi:hypothetical protein
MRPCPPFVTPILSIQKRKWLSKIAGLLALSAGAINSGLAQESRNEFWPEADVFYRLNAVSRLFLQVAPAINRQETFGECQYGAYAEFGVFPIFRREFGETYDIDRFRFLRFRAGVSYGTNYEWSSHNYHEWRGILELTTRILLPENILIAGRGRAELRWLNNAYSTRYRLRVGVERETPINTWLTVIPIAMVEVFYDTRFDTWSRTETTLGIGVPVYHWFVLETSYAYQHNTRTEPINVHALLMAGLFYF